LFEATKTTNQALAMNLNELLDSYNLRKKIIIYVKDEGANFNAMTMALKIVVNYDILELEEVSRNMFWACFLQNLSTCYN
jgi:hypothetical protein